MDDWAETDLAWELAEIASLHLPERDRTVVYTAIGAGYSYTAITKLLETIDGANMPVPAALVERLVDWLRAYAHHDSAAYLRELLDSIRSVS
ncbi:MAG: hypothetical protein JO236_16470 [Mycobacterium sp.]|uniref:hypothetical protein n=1 Tax=Mycobacterium sp. TaxID=1785 RepID=UPI001EB378E9|nr:hypothetical protein [Mycobacterium sp.]MBW0019123.1 hypothetical protein [Mycobacterium sp.]